MALSFGLGVQELVSQWFPPGGSPLLQAYVVQAFFNAAAIS